MPTDTPMQLGMIGLGRMGANLVRRLMRDGHRCVAYDRNPDVVKALVGEGATGANSLAEVQARLELGQFDDPFHRMTAEFGLAYSEWGRDWCAQAERRLLAEGCLGGVPALGAQRIDR